MSRLDILDFWPLSLPRSEPIPSPASYLGVPCSLFWRFNPNNVHLIGSVFNATLVCTVVHAAGVDRGLRKAILASIISNRALKVVESMDLNVPLINALIGLLISSVAVPNRV